MVIKQFEMAPKVYPFPNPGCKYSRDALKEELAIRFLEMHVAQAHSVSSKPEKPKNLTWRWQGMWSMHWMESLGFATSFIGKGFRVPMLLHFRRFW